MSKNISNEINSTPKEFTCVSCPMGCLLTALKTANGEIKITGNSCKRGLEYGLQELKDPRRNISSTVKIIGGNINALPVKTSAPIPKGKIFEVMTQINNVSVQVPIKVGQIIIENVLGTGCNIVSAKTIF